MSLCKYKDSLGKPNEGFHKHFLGIAIMDVLATILIVLVIHKIFGWNYWLIILCTVVFTILIHRLFCVNTTINKLIFGKV